MLTVAQMVAAPHAWAKAQAAPSDAAARRSIVLLYGYLSMTVAVKVLQEIAGETVAQMAAAPRAKRRSEAAPEAAEEAAEEEPDSLQELQARLDAVRS